MKIHRELQQKSWEWFQARAGKITGSELGNLITDKGAIRSWAKAMPNSYLHRKLAEKWRGQPLQSFQGNQQTDQGIMHEERARRYFASLLDSDIQTIGGIESDDGLLWCSPDGIIGSLENQEEKGLEIKCPNPDTHIGWLLNGQQVPEEHILQVQFGLFVTGWQEWQFLSYCIDMPHLVITVEPDLEIFETINEAIADFEARYEQGWNELCALNGGPPPPRGPTPDELRRQEQNQNEYEDITPMSSPRNGTRQRKLERRPKQDL